MRPFVRIALLLLPGCTATHTPATSSPNAGAVASGRVVVTGTFTLPYFGTAPLGTANASFTDLVVFIEGLDRDASNDFSIMVTVAQSAGALGHTLVVTPEFQALTNPDGTACTGHVDDPAPTDLVWNCNTWSDGLFATNGATVTSYGALDTLVSRVLAAQPSITRVTISGFSAGGQFTQRYVAANRVDGQFPGTSFRYVVGDPSSYLYFTPSRPMNASGCTLSGCPDGFAAPDAGGCRTYNEWKYGTDSLQGAAVWFTAAQLEAAYESRSVTYLLGTLDDAPTTAADYSDLDVTCAAEVEGPYRYQRGVAYYVYATTELGLTSQQAFDVAGCAHTASCVFQSDAGVAAVFGP